MRLLPKTWALLLIAVGLGVANAWTISPEFAPQGLPALPAIIPDDVTKIVISSPIDRLELRRTHFEKGNAKAERWEIIAPIQAPADVAQIRTLIRTFGLGVPMDAKLDEGNHKDYLLDDQDAKVVELYTTAEAPALQVIVGRAAGPNASFVRLPNADAVYRAEVGSRQRYDQAPSAWRDKVVLDQTEVAELTITRDTETLRFVKVGEGWTLNDTVADTPTVEALVRALGRLRAGNVHNSAFPGGFEPPLATVRFGEHTVTVGTASDAKVSYVKVDDRAEVYAVTSQVARFVGAPIAAFADRRIFEFSPSDVASLRWETGGLRVVVERTPSGWNVREPANTDVDDEAMGSFVEGLAGLRSVGAVGGGAFVGEGRVLAVALLDGKVLKLEVGQRETDAEGKAVVRVRTGGRQYGVQMAALSALEQAFGR